MEYWSEKNRVIATPELNFFVRPQSKAKLDHIPSPLIPISNNKNLNDYSINAILTLEGHLAERNKDDSSRLPERS